MFRSAAGFSKLASRSPLNTDIHYCKNMEEILAHQVGGDPFGVHELFVLAATAGVGILLAVRIYARRLTRLLRLEFLLLKRAYSRAAEFINPFYH